jgi:hypothetical protein
LTGAQSGPALNQIQSDPKPPFQADSLMRHLLQPQVLRTASIAAAISSLACYPRLELWSARPFPIWYLEATIFFCSIMLWGFVFAWHERYGGGPVFRLKLEPGPFLVATIGGTATALAAHVWLDPWLRPKFPEEYPPDWRHWLAAVPFLLAFNQLFGVFAPVDWLMRLFRNRWVAAALPGLLSAALLLYKSQKLSLSIPPHWLAVMILGRMLSGLLLVWLYLRGGVVLVWWWGLLQEARHLLDFP